MGWDTQVPVGPGASGIAQLGSPVRVGTAAQIAAYTGAAGELTFASDTKVLYVHDGATQGGNQVIVGTTEVEFTTVAAVGGPLAADDTEMAADIDDVTEIFIELDAISSNGTNYINATFSNASGAITILYVSNGTNNGASDELGTSFPVVVTAVAARNYSGYVHAKKIAGTNWWIGKSVTTRDDSSQLSVTEFRFSDGGDNSSFNFSLAGGSTDVMDGGSWTLSYR